MQPFLGRVAAALLLIPFAAACSNGSNEIPPPASPASTPARLPPTPVAGQFTGFTTPCPTVHGYVGGQPDDLKLSISRITRCGYDGKAKYPMLYSVATINSPIPSQGTPTEVAEGLFQKAKDSVREKAKPSDVITVADLPGLGDQAFQVVSSRGHTTFVVLRSGNVNIQAYVYVMSQGDRAKELRDLKALTPLATELATALLAQLK